MIISKVTKKQGFNFSLEDAFLEKQQGWWGQIDPPPTFLGLKLNSVFFKSVLSSRRDNTGPATRDHVKFSQMRDKTPLKL